MFLRYPDIVRAHDGVEVPPKSCVLHFERQALSMGVGHKDNPFSGCAHGLEKVDDVRVNGNQVIDFLFEDRDVQAKLAAPVVDAIPVKRALGTAKAWKQLALGCLDGKAVLFGIALRHVYLPEVIVIMQVKQRAVHVQKHRADFAPTNHIYRCDRPEVRPMGFQCARLVSGRETHNAGCAPGVCAMTGRAGYYTSFFDRLQTSWGRFLNLYLRLLIVLIKMLFVRRRGVLEPARLRFRVLPTDCDLNFHLNNGRYLTFMDLGRIHLLGQIGLLYPLMRARWMPVLGAAEINFIRPLKPLRRFELVTRLVTWDEKYFYIEQRFEAGGRLCAIALVKGLFMAGRQRVDSGSVLKMLNLDMEPPNMPEVVRHWNDLTTLKKKHYS